MTKEEAIGLFKDVEVLVFRDVKQKYFHEDIEEAFKLAIRLLEQEPKTGHWIYDRTRDWDGECKYECSECGMGSDVDYPYCMRCGAKMESEDKI